MTDLSDDLSVFHSLLDTKASEEDIKDCPSFFREKRHTAPYFQVEGMDSNLPVISQIPKARNIKRE